MSPYVLYSCIYTHNTIRYDMSFTFDFVTENVKQQQKNYLLATM